MLSMHSDIKQPDFLALALSRMTFINTDEKKKLYSKLDNIFDLALLSIEDISSIVGRHIKTVLWKPSECVKTAERDERLMRAYSISAVKIGSQKYPAHLAEIYNPPFLLYCRGNIEVLSKAGLAVVGTRRPSQNGIRCAYNLAQEAVREGCIVISGLALGIDAFAHRGALDAASGLPAGSGAHTAAVLACGLDSLYPVSNKRIASAVISTGGCLISEYAPGETPLKWRFPERNRIISGLSAAAVVIEAPAGSGALITADFALEQNRDLFIHEAAVDYLKTHDEKRLSTKKRSVQDYIDEGAPVISHFSDIADYLSDAPGTYSAKMNADNDINEQMQLNLI